MFGRNKVNRVLFESNDDNIKILEIYRNSKGTFKLFCDVKRAEGTMGINTNFCISMLTSSGWVVVADMNDLDLNKVSLKEEKEVTLEKIETGFSKFRSFADVI